MEVKRLKKKPQEAYRVWVDARRMETLTIAGDYRTLLPKIDKPVVVCAAKSGYMDAIVAMQKSIPNSKLEIFEGDGHALFVDDPDKFNALVEDFLLNLAR